MSSPHFLSGSMKARFSHVLCCRLFQEICRIARCTEACVYATCGQPRIFLPAYYHAVRKHSGGVLAHHQTLRKTAAVFCIALSVIEHANVSEARAAAPPGYFVVIRRFGQKLRHFPRSTSASPSTKCRGPRHFAAPLRVKHPPKDTYAMAVFHECTVFRHSFPLKMHFTFPADLVWSPG